MVTINLNSDEIRSGLSPLNWYTSGSNYIKTPNPGAYSKFNFTGTSIGLEVSVTDMNLLAFDASLYPVIKYTIDGISATRQLLSTDTSAFTLSSSLSNTTHSFRLDLIGVDESGTIDRWNTAVMSLILKRYTLDDGAMAIASKKRSGGYMMNLGDSITEGAVTLAPAGVYAQVEDATLGYQNILADKLNVEHGVCAFAGESWTGGVSNVPGLINTYNYIWSGSVRVFDPVPNIVTVNMGTNGSVVSGSVTTFMGNLRSAVGAGCFINMIVPFNQSNSTPITNGYNDYVATTPNDKLTTLIDLGSAGNTFSTSAGYAYDSVHPNRAGHIALAEILYPKIRFPLKAGTPYNGGLF